jgi:hypothetical protein
MSEGRYDIRRSFHDLSEMATYMAGLVCLYADVSTCFNSITAVHIDETLYRYYVVGGYLNS